MDTAGVFGLSSKAAEELRGAARLLFVSGSILGSDRAERRSEFDYGDDTVVAASMTCEIGADLISGATMLLSAGNMYAASALIRQMLEVEYLLWAFREDADDLDRWRLIHKPSSERV